MKTISYRVVTLNTENTMVVLNLKRQTIGNLYHMYDPLMFAGFGDLGVSMVFILSKIEKKIEKIKKNDKQNQLF